VTPREAAALHRLLDAYLATDELDPGSEDLTRTMKRLERLEHDHSAYDEEQEAHDG
jgi:hypothetical protein